MKTVDPGQILICRQKSTSTVPFSHVNPFANLACTVMFKPGARYAQKYVSTISSIRVKRNASWKRPMNFVYMAG